MMQNLAVLLGIAPKRLLITAVYEGSATLTHHTALHSYNDPLSFQNEPLEGSHELETSSTGLSTMVEWNHANMAQSEFLNLHVGGAEEMTEVVVLILPADSPGSISAAQCGNIMHSMDVKTIM